MAVAAQPDPLEIRGSEGSDAGLLFEAHSDRLFAYCLRSLGSRAEAEDAVQTTFLYAHRALQRGVVPESEYAWLHAIAKNVCRWQQRTLARRGRLSSDIDLDALPSRGDDAGEVREMGLALEDALASIPESQRRAFMLREWHGLASHEVASQLGMSTAATYALLTRARRSLARAMTAGTRPLRSLDLAPLLYKLKLLLAGGTAKAVATSVAVGTVAVGGIAVERAVDDRQSPRPAPPANVETSAGASARGTDAIVVESASTTAREGTARSLRGGDVRPPAVLPGSESAGPGVETLPRPTVSSAGPGDSPAVPSTTDPRPQPPSAEPPSTEAPPTEPPPAFSEPAPLPEPPPLPVEPTDPPLLPDDLLDPLPIPELELPPLDEPLPPPLEDLPTVDELLPPLPPLPPLPLPPLPPLPLPLP